MKIFNVARSDKNEILTNVFRSKGVLVGTSTMNNVMMPKIAGLVEEMTGLRFRNKRASAFGSHGWSGGAVDRLSTRLQDAGFEMSLSLKAKWRPDQTLWSYVVNTVAKSPVSGRSRRCHRAR